MKEEVRILLGDAASNFSDAQIGLMCKLALQYVEDYTGVEVADYSLTLLAERIVVIMLNKINSEGISSESFNGTSVSYIDGLPDDIIQALNKKRKVVFK